MVIRILQATKLEHDRAGYQTLQMATCCTFRTTQEWLFFSSANETNGIWDTFFYDCFLGHDRETKRKE
jgi:hypothetical protein